MIDVNQLFNFKTMRKLYIVLTCFLVFTIPALNAYSQKQMNNWFWGFGGKGVTFNTVPPSAISRSESSLGGAFFRNADVCISDSSGKFLFAYNGWYFFNEHGTVADVFQFHDELRQALCFPTNENPNQFHCFKSLISDINKVCCNTLWHCIYDSSLKNGTGGVVSSKILVSNVDLVFAATPHANKKDYWLTIAQFQTKKILSFLINNEGGNNPPIISYSYTKKDSNLIGGGKMRFNHSGTKLYRSTYSGIELYDFDKVTGILSNPIRININEALSAEFSADDTKLYVTNIIGGVFQVNLSSDDSIKISASIKNIYNKPVCQDIQIGPDKKIYFLSSNSRNATSGKSTNYPLHCINSPNSAGKYCREDSIKIFYDDSTPHNSLPYYVTPFLYEPFILDFPDEVCPEEQVVFMLKNGENATAQAWSFGDGASWTGGAAQHSFRQDGVYEIIATITDKQNKTYLCRKEITVRNKTKTIKEIKHD